MLVTVGTDKVCKVWDIATQKDGKYEPELISKKNLKQGMLFSVQTYADIPWVLAAGGSSGQLAIWDTEEDKRVYGHFKDQLSDKAKMMKGAADQGLAEDEQMQVVDATGDSSGFEDVDSDEEEAPKKKKGKKSNK